MNPREQREAAEWASFVAGHQRLLDWAEQREYHLVAALDPCRHEPALHLELATMSDTGLAYLHRAQACHVLAPRRTWWLLLPRRLRARWRRRFRMT